MISLKKVESLKNEKLIMILLKIKYLYYIIIPPLKQSYT